MISPKRTAYRKPHRGNFVRRQLASSTICFGEIGIRAMSSRWISSRQIESSRRVLTRYVRRTGKLWIRVFPDKPITARADESRIGSGKGSIRYWVAAVRPGQIILEINGLNNQNARQAIRIAGSKLPVLTKIVKM